MKFKKKFGLLIITAIWIALSSPFFFKGLVPFPSDYLASFFSPWNSYRISGPVKNESMPDIIGQIYPWRYFAVETIKSGQIPLWNPYSFSGTPHLANYQSAVLNPLNIGFFVFPFIDWWSFLIILQPLLAGLFTYMFIKSLKRSEFAAILSSLSFMFCGFVVSWMEYGTLTYAILYLPLALYSIEKYYGNKKYRYPILLALTFPLSFFSGHFQISIYFLLFIVGYLLFKYLQTKKTRTILYLLLAIFFGMLLCAPQLFPSIELYSQSFRSTIFAKTEVIPWGYLPTLFAPDFFGNPVTRNMLFGHYAEWNSYFGLIPLFFALYALTKWKNSTVRFFIIAGAVSLLLAFDSPLQNLLVVLKIPVLSTSALSRIIVLFSFSGAVLAGFGLDILFEYIKSKQYKHILIFLGIFTLIFLILWTAIFFKIYLTPEQAAIAKSNLRLPSVILAVFFILTALLILLRKKKDAVFSILLLIIILVSLDIYRFSSKWIPFSPRNFVYPNTGVINIYPQIKGENRIFGNFGGEGTVYYGLLGTEGYDAVYIRRYGQFISALDHGKITDAYRSVVELPLAGEYILEGGNLLGIKYFIHKVSDGQQVWEFPFWKYDPISIKLKFDDERYEILENTNSYPRAFLVNKVIREQDPQKILDIMFDKNTNLRETAVVEKDLLSDKYGSGSAQIKKYEPNYIHIKTESSSPSFLVLTDTYYPGWNAYVDGEKTKIYRTDFTFRGVVVPKGERIIEFKYEPKSFTYGIYTAIIGLLGLIFLRFFSRTSPKTYD
jgi:hypothetical protein